MKEDVLKEMLNKGIMNLEYMTEPELKALMVYVKDYANKTVYKRAKAELERRKTMKCYMCEKELKEEEIRYASKGVFSGDMLITERRILQEAFCKECCEKVLVLLKEVGKA